MPDILPVFPLEGVLLLPRGHLPLNIFEPRYRAMVEDALKNDRLIGMIQPSRGLENDNPGLYDIGCAGRITSFNETGDNRYSITLTGVSRFRLKSELPLLRGYRRADVDWQDFQADLQPPGALHLDRERLRRLLTGYFTLHGISCEWNAIDNAPDEKLVNCLSMICPLEACEKQALLEAADCKARADMFMAMLELSVHGGEPPKCAPSRH